MSRGHAKRKAKRERRFLVYPESLSPHDWLRFIQLTPFERCWVHLRLSDDDLRGLEMCLMLDPTKNPVIKGTGGVRKARFTSSDWDSGKSGGLRVYYLYLPSKGLIFLIHCHLRTNKKESLAEGDKKRLKQLVTEIVALVEEGAANAGRKESR